MSAGELSRSHQSSANLPEPPPGLGLRFVLTWIVNAFSFFDEKATKSIPVSVVNCEDSIPYFKIYIVQVILQTYQFEHLSISYGKLQIMTQQCVQWFLYSPLPHALSDLG